MARTRPRGIGLSAFSASIQEQVSTNPAEFTFVNDVLGGSALDTHSANFSPSAAWQLDVTRYLGRDGNDRDHFLSFQFWGLDEFSASAAVHGSINPHYDLSTYTPNPNPDQSAVPKVQFFAGNLLSQFPLTAPLEFTKNPTAATFLSDGFNRADEQSIHYSSTFNNFEINTEIKTLNSEDQLVLHPNGRWYRQCRPGIYCSYLFGARFIDMRESFQFLSAGHVQPVEDPALVGYSNAGRYSIHSQNELLGLQAGGDIEFRFCRWEFSISGKICPCINFAEQSSRVRTTLDGNTVFDSSWSARHNVSAVVGELGFGSKYKFRPDWIGHMNYDFMWMGDLALAPEQLVFEANPPPEVRTAGTEFMHGLTLGLEHTW